MIPSVQFQSCNDTVTTIHKDILEKLDLPSASSRNSDEEIQLSTQPVNFDTEQILMHSAEFNDSDDITSSQDYHSIEVETSDDLITTCGDGENVINYTIIGNGLILIEGSQMDFDDDAKDNANDLRPINGIDLLVTLKSNDNDNIIEEEKECSSEMHTDLHSEMNLNVEQDLIELAMMHDNDMNDDNNEEKEEHMESDTRTAVPSIGDNCEEDDESSSEHELTNLGWLIDLKNLTQWPVDSNVTNRKNATGNSHSSLVNGIGSCIMNDIDDDENTAAPSISEKDLSEERFKKFMIQVKQSQKNYAERERIYKVDPLEKPPFNYAQIIAMAMMDRGRMTLKDICKWIQEHFAYFRYNKNWNNSIRHNLSLHFCFTKIARDKTEKGKGGYWELSMNATKSEKKRIRNRRKHRDDCSRVFHPYRNRIIPRKTAQKSTSSNDQESVNCAEVLPSLNNTINDSCNVSSASDGSLSMCSTNGINDETRAIWPEITCVTNAQFIQTLQSAVHNEQMNQDLISDVITNDMIIIHGADLDQSDNEIIQCNFDKTNSQNINSYFNDQPIDHVQQQPHLSGANGNTLTETNISTAMMDDSSNETFIKSSLDQQTNLLANSTSVSTSTSNVIVEPMPYSLSHMDTVIDIEHEFGNLVNMPDPELTVDGFFDYSSW